MTETPSELDEFQHTHDSSGHQIQTAGHLDASEPACPDCGRHVGGPKHPYQHARTCPAYTPHPNSIAAQATRHVAAVEDSPDYFAPMRHPRGHPDVWVHAEVGSKEYDAAVAARHAASNHVRSSQTGAIS